MTHQRHDYSGHAFHELELESSNLDPAKHPERAKDLQLELLKRLGAASAAASEVATRNALAVGAHYTQLDERAARRFFWPFIGASFLFSFVGGFIVGFAASLVESIFAAFGVGTEGSLTGQAIRVATSLLLAIPVAAVWLRIFTKRSFGGYGLRLVAAPLLQDAA